ncbi:MAG: serine hydrolase [Candidatus Heimdallarchaeota archaeon]|nr:serine hydrolase [Candidatus Heimdallarchaeota archaeon]
MDYEHLFSSKLDELIIDAMQRNNTVGTAISIVEDGRLHSTRCYGAKNFEHSLPVDEDALFCVASVTKSFICAGVMKLQEQGKLKVNDPINKYLPITIGFEDDPIQIHHLMSHQSGIPDLTDYMWYRNREEIYGLQEQVPKYPFSSWEDGFRFLNGSQEYLSRPGERFHYNNFSYGILSKLITEVSGIPYKQYLRECIFSPLKMDRSGFYNEIRDDTNISRTYMSKPGSKTKTLLHVPIDDIRLTKSLDEAAGGLFSTVVELSNYMVMLLNGGKFNGTQVLQKESVDEILSMQFKEEYPNAAFAAFYGQKSSGYGYGFAIDEDFFGYKLIQHSGSFTGASAWFAFIPDLQRGVIVLSNHHPSPRQYAQAILTESLGYDCKVDWPVQKLYEHHKRLCGTYHSYKGMIKVTVGTDGAQLLVTIPGQGIIKLIPMASPFALDYYFPSATGGRDPVQFVFDDDTIWLYQERVKLKKVSNL